eukprot:g44504.t1
MGIIPFQVKNPVPRVRHPDWLHKKLLEKNDVYKQKKISELFTNTGVRQVTSNQQLVKDQQSEIGDLEDFGASKHRAQPVIPISTKRTREPVGVICLDFQKVFAKELHRRLLNKTRARGVRGKNERLVWLRYQKRKWELQSKQRKARRKRRKLDDGAAAPGRPIRAGPTPGLGSFLRRTARTILDMPWQIVQVNYEI